MSLPLVVALVAVLAGAVLQRATGLGFTLTAGPFLVLVLPPYEGVALANLLSMTVCAVVLVTAHHGVDWRKAGAIVAGALVAVVPGALIARSLPAPALFVVVGGVVTLAGVVAALDRPIPVLSRRGGAVLTGFFSQLGNVTAGVGGPPLAVYAATTRWARAGFVPTAQAVGLVTNGMSLAAKHDARLDPHVLGVFVATVLVGTVGGTVLSRRISERGARVVVLSLAIGGGLVAVGKGIATW